jgi:ABC-type uncharacterized transport system auxiliary subunit
VSRPLEAVASDVQLLLDIRKFQISSRDTAEVEIGCKHWRKWSLHWRALVSRVGGARSAGHPAAVLALDKAFAEAAQQLLAWTMQISNEPSAAETVGGKKSSGG